MTSATARSSNGCSSRGWSTWTAPRPRRAVLAENYVGLPAAPDF